MTLTKAIEATEKQKTAIFNMRHALGVKDPFINMPTTVSEASREITKLKGIISNNLSIGGAINPRPQSRQRFVCGGEVMTDELQDCLRMIKLISSVDSKSPYDNEMAMHKLCTIREYAEKALTHAQQKPVKVTVYDTSCFLYGNNENSHTLPWLDLEEAVVRLRDKYPNGLKIINNKKETNDEKNTSV